MLAKTVSKMWPDGNYIGLKLVVTDDNRPDLGAGPQVVILWIVKRQYVKGVDISNEVRDEISKEAQGLIDKYKAQRKIFDKAVYGTMVAQVDGALVL